MALIFHYKDDQTGLEFPSACANVEGVMGTADTLFLSLNIYKDLQSKADKKLPIKKMNLKFQGSLDLIGVVSAFEMYLKTLPEFKDAITV